MNIDFVTQFFYSLKSKPLNSAVRTEHFTNTELNSLITSFGNGNTLVDPYQMCELAEKFYKDYDSWIDVKNDPYLEQMFKDGLHHFLWTLWDMVAAKRGLPLKSYD